jgi:hypothetical protein
MNTANPSTITAGVTEIPKIAGLHLLALMTAARLPVLRLNYSILPYQYRDVFNAARP